MLYMAMQLVVSLGFIYLCPLQADAMGVSLVAMHWLYLIGAFLVLAVAYVLLTYRSNLLTLGIVSELSLLSLNRSLQEEVLSSA